MSRDRFYSTLAENIKTWARELGFQEIGISDIALDDAEARLEQWLSRGYQGDMSWLKEHGKMRSRPAELLEGTTRIISARMDYLPGDTAQIQTLKDPTKAYIARYALGRDYHKLIRKRLSTLAKRIETAVNDAFPDDAVVQRAFVDSAPVMERAIAEKAGLGWVGKNTLILNKHAGSWFFLGEIYTNIPLPINAIPVTDQCGDCTACMQVCPTDAFPQPYEMDASRCISYLTIEKKGDIPEEFRDPIGNRVFGCDDCQAICPWNKFAPPTQETDFLPRHNLDSSELLSLFLWTEEEFLKRTEGSPIRRLGYERWQRNLAIGLGNAPPHANIVNALESALANASPLLRDHLDWALLQQKTINRRRKRKIKTQKRNI